MVAEQVGESTASGKQPRMEEAGSIINLYIHIFLNTLYLYQENIYEYAIRFFVKLANIIFGYMCILLLLLLSRLRLEDIVVGFETVVFFFYHLIDLVGPYVS